MNLNNIEMDDQYRRGINRPNANRLSLSLGPLVAQRSLLFRIQSDLVYKSTYGELTPAEESAFFAMTPSARILGSAIMGKTPMSSASIYSQDSWRPPISGILYTPFRQGPENARRRAIMFSPTNIQWLGLRSAKNSAPPSAPAQSAMGKSMHYIGSPIPHCVPEDFTEISPVHSAAFNVSFVAHAGITIPSIEISRANTSISPIESSDAPFVTINSPKMEYHAQQEAVSTPTHVHMQDAQSAPRRDSALVDDGKKLRKKKPIEDVLKRAPKPSGAFGRVMAHLSLQPTKKELDQRRKTAMPTMPVISKPLPLMPRTENSQSSSVTSDPSGSATVSVSSKGLFPQTPLVVSSLLLPSVRMSPIRTSFIANSFLSPNAPVNAFSFLSEPMVANMSEAGTRARAARASQGPLKRRTMPPPALNLLPMYSAPIQPTMNVPGHRRHRSSPAVMKFSWKNNEQDIPPVPKLPAMIR